MAGRFCCEKVHCKVPYCNACLIQEINTLKQFQSGIVTPHYSIPANEESSLVMPINECQYRFFRGLHTGYYCGGELIDNSIKFCNKHINVINLRMQARTPIYHDEIGKCQSYFHN